MFDSSEKRLKTNVRKAFKGLDDQHYAILEFFHRKGPAKKFRASRYFEGKEPPPKPKQKIPQATVYRKIKYLEDRNFLTAVSSERFKRGKVEWQVDFLKVTLPKGILALLGTDISVTALQVFEKLLKPGKISEAFRNISSGKNLVGLLNRVFESVNDDLTDKPVTFDTLLFNFTMNNPEYVMKMLERANSGHKDEKMKLLEEVLKLVKLFHMVDSEQESS